MEKKRKQEITAKFRTVTRELLPDCNTKLGFVATFVILCLALSFAALLIYGVLTLAALIAVFLVEKIWPMVLLVFLSSLVIFCNRYEDAILGKEEKASAK